MQVARLEIAPDVKQDRRRGDLAQQRRELRGIVRDDLRAEVRDALKLRREIDMLLPAHDGIGHLRPDALDGPQVRSTGEEDAFRALENLEQPAKARRADAGEHIEGDIGLGGGHFGGY